MAIQTRNSAESTRISRK